MKDINFQLFNISLEILDIYMSDIQMRCSMTSKGLHNILTCWKIVYIFKIIE